MIATSGFYFLANGLSQPPKLHIIRRLRYGSSYRSPLALAGIESNQSYQLFNRISVLQPSRSERLEPQPSGG
jgi:hypothetical protein